MSLNYKVKTVSTTTNITLYEAELGWRPDDIYRDYQISVDGLDGGTFTAEVFVPVKNSAGEIVPSTTTKTLASGQTESKVVTAQGTGDVIAVGFKVTVAALGGGADPKVTILANKRGI